MRAALWVLLPCGLADWAPARYAVDLGQEPERRWEDVVNAEKETFRWTLQSVLTSPLIKRYVPAARMLVGNAFEERRLFPEEHLREMRGIARGMGVKLADLVLVGAFYDLAAANGGPVAFPACAGVVAQSAAGEIVHGRNLDYDFVDALGRSTLIVDFKRDGRVLFTAVTFGPTPVFNTAVRHGAFSVSQNERDRGTILENLWDALVLGRPAIFSRVRQAVEEISSFEGAVGFFSGVKLDAAAYFVLGGTRPGEGAVITRDRGAAVDVWRLNPAAGRWYVLETNYDHTFAPPRGDDRRHPLERAMNAIGPEGIDAASMWDVISLKHANRTSGERPPLNSETVYSTVMQAARPAAFKTLVRSHSIAQSTLVV